MKKVLPIAIGTLLLLGFAFWETPGSSSKNKINGLSLVAPRQEISVGDLHSLEFVSPNWVAVIPYGYTPENSFEVIYSTTPKWWWGESLEGARKTTAFLKAKGYMTMMKPQVWVLKDGWAGDFLPRTSQDWSDWENSYRKFILEHAKMAESLNVELFCVGTEYRKTTKAKPEYWVELIKSVREVYQGKITYAANWDEYQHVEFWEELDFIGIDAYFPLSEEKTPKLDQLENAWKPIQDDLAELSGKNGKKILFTEYGYCSMDYACRGEWRKTGKEFPNMYAQKNAYQALYSSFWEKDWFAGGFFWKWHVNHNRAGGENNLRFTPQNKPTQAVIKTQYSASGS